MQRRHARYPFLEAARAAVESADVDLAGLVQAGGPPVDRARDRVERALLAGTVAVDGQPPSVRAELLSYPIARVIVSLLDIPGAIEKYAAAEAATARERFVQDFEADLELKSTPTDRLTLEELLADFELADRLEPLGDGRFDVAVTAYLALAGPLEDDRWRLATRPLDDGRLPVDRPELYTLLREAVRRRVAADLPLSVPDDIAAALEDDLAAVRSAVADLDPPLAFDAVVPGLFPPCQRALLQRVHAGETLPAASRFSLVSFLVSVGLDADGVVALCHFDDEAAAAVREQVKRLRANGTSIAAPPSCAVMVEYGDCVNKDALCETIDHPLSYYEERLEQAPAEKITDWEPAP